LSFLNTPATELDPNLAELAKVQNPAVRTLKTMAYLKSLPALTPLRAENAVKTPKPDVAALMQTAPALRVTHTQVNHLSKNFIATQLTAKAFSQQIKTNLREVPATNGNYLQEPLQTILEFADVLEALSVTQNERNEPFEQAALILRLAQLEMLVIRISQQLQNERNVREALEALTSRSVFVQSFSEEAGKQLARAAVWVPTFVIATGFYQAATHFLGVDNPILEMLNNSISRVPRE
jgi:hypothetical protein